MASSCDTSPLIETGEKSSLLDFLSKLAQSENGCAKRFAIFWMAMPAIKKTTTPINNNAISMRIKEKILLDWRRD